MIQTAVLRTRKGVQGVGKKIAELFGGIDSQVVCDVHPKKKLAADAVIINYGRSTWPVWWKATMIIINSPDSIAISSNKIKCLLALEAANVPCLKWTKHVEEADLWIESGKRVFVRAIVNGKKGRGISIVSMDDLVEGNYLLPEAPLYTLAYDKKHEFRVFVAGGKVVDIVQKKKMGAAKLRQYGIKEVDMDSRNYKKGWVFAHADMDMGPKGRQAAVKICIAGMKAIGLDYGAVDLLYKKHDDMVICEINSAPEMRRSKTTWNAMSNYFLKAADNE